MSLVDGFGGDVEFVSRGNANVLLLSLRRVEDVVAFCAQYEFEDVIASVAPTDMAILGSLERVELSRKAYKLVRYLSGSARLSESIAPKFASFRLEKDYELFLPIFNHLGQVFAIRALPDWRKRCRRAACVINEIWDLPGDYLLETLRQFDHIFIGSEHMVEQVARKIGRPCTYSPL